MHCIVGHGTFVNHACMPGSVCCSTNHQSCTYLDTQWLFKVAHATQRGRDNDIRSMQAAMALHMPHGYGEDVYDFQNLSGG
jgi:hypothetical protein